ncbi:MAG: sialidase family protein [Ktedonobacteraceae bacterium]
MYPMREQVRCWLVALGLLCLMVAGCVPFTINVAPQATARPDYSLQGGGPCVRLGAHPHAPYSDVQVSQDSYLAHSEPMLAEDPQNPLHLVGGSKFFTDPAHYRFQIGYYASFDGGCSWRDGGVLQGFKSTILTSDISFAFGPHNVVYAATLFSVTTLTGGSGIAVWASSDGGKTFGLPVNVTTDTTGQVFNDKPWIAVDTTKGPHSGAVYVVWSYDHGANCGGGNFCQQDLAFSRSIDGGKTFSKFQVIEGHAPFCSYDAPGRPKHSNACDEVIGAIPVVGPDGTISVAFAYIDQISNTIPTLMLVVSSFDGGMTWQPPVWAATIHDIYGLFPPERYRNESLPAFACDPRTGQLYLTWSDKGKKDADILFETSTDHGQTWSQIIRANDDPVGNGANQFQPQLAVAPNGVVTISFFDTRMDAQHKLIDVYLAQSVDHGVSFLSNVRVTTQSWDPAVKAPIDGNGLQFIGDYQGLATDNAFAHPFWNDTRTGSQQIFTAAVPSAQPRGSD